MYAFDSLNSWLCDESGSIPRILHWSPFHISQYNPLVIVFYYFSYCHASWLSWKSSWAEEHFSWEPHTLHYFSASPSYRSRDINFAQALNEDPSIIYHGNLLQIQDQVNNYVGLIVQELRTCMNALLPWLENFSDCDIWFLKRVTTKEISALSLGESYKS